MSDLLTQFQGLPPVDIPVTSQYLKFQGPCFRVFEQSEEESRMSTTYDSNECRLVQRFKNGRLVRFTVRERCGAGDFQDVDGDALKPHLPSLIEGQRALQLLTRAASRQFSLKDVVRSLNRSGRVMRRPRKTKVVDDGE
jgi:hypothetical protein